MNRNRLSIIVTSGIALFLATALWLDLIPRAHTVYSDTRLLMGTLVSISVWGHPKGKAETAMQKAFAEFARLEEVLSWQRPTSEVSQVNQVSRETWVSISTELGTLLQRGLLLGQRSEGAFSMALQPLTQLWGFSSEHQDEKPPAKEKLDRWLRLYPTVDAIRLMQKEDKSFHVQLANSAVGLDLGALGKGYAIDQAISVLRKEGIANAIVDAGGDLRVIGSKGSNPWRIGLQNPRQKDQIISMSQLRGDIAMMTSGDYERFFLLENIRYHHILDPKTAEPARTGLSSVSVQGKNAAEINGLSTAIFVLGVEKGLRLLKQYPGSEALLISEKGEPTRTPAFIADWLQEPIKQ
ncbi:MAG: FAD:protein FMN transferase [Magnetococcales bacterium]|nr:FAD:protein FMN transferase [Magnetococcales bacterium]